MLISARGNLSAKEKRDIVMGVNQIVATVSTASNPCMPPSGGSNYTLNNQGGVPVDNIGRITVELKDYHERGPGKKILEDIRQQAPPILPACMSKCASRRQGPPTGKDVMIDVSSDDYADACADGHRRDPQAYGQAAGVARRRRHAAAARHRMGSAISTAKSASRFGANAQTIGTAVQLVTNGILVGKYRPDDADEQIDIRVRYPEDARGMHALDNLRVPTANGVVPISNFVKRVPAQQVNSIERVNGHRVYHVRANMKAQCGPGVTTNCAARTRCCRAPKWRSLKTWIATQTIPA